MTNRWNRIIYALWAPVYDRLLAMAPFTAARERAIAALDLEAGEKVFLIGVGTGADLPLLRRDVDVVGIDLSERMLGRARRKARGLSMDADLQQGDAQSLPFADGDFDAAVLTLILSVVPDARRCLSETLRVVRPGGRVVVFDKFLPDEQDSAPFFRRVINVLTRIFGTDINRRFEEMARGLGCEVHSDEPSGFSSAYRIILLRRVEAVAG